MDNKQLLKDVLLTQVELNPKEAARITYNLILTLSWLEYTMKENCPDIEKRIHSFFSVLRTKGEPTKYLLSIVDAIIEDENKEKKIIRRYIKEEPKDNILRFPVEFWKPSTIGED